MLTGGVDWQTAEGAASVAGATLLMVALLIAGWQTRESLKIRRVQGLLGFLQQLEARSIRRTRRFLYLHRNTISGLLSGSHSGLDDLDRFLQKTGAAEGGPQSLSDLRDDLAVLEFAALLDINGMIPRSVRLAYLAPTMADVWPLVEPIVAATRRQISSNVYLQHVEAVHQLAVSGASFRRGSGRARRQALQSLVARSKRAVADRAGPQLPVPW